MKTQYWTPRWQFHVATVVVDPAWRNSNDNRAEDRNACKCRKPVASYCQNLLAKNLLAEVEAKCIWCNVNFNLNTSKDHVHQCDQLEIPCRFCKEMVKRADEQKHSHEECKQPFIFCACGTRLKQMDLEQHSATVCLFKEEPCPLKCGGQIKRYVQE